MSKLDELIEELCPAGVQYKKLNEIAHYAKKRIDITEIDKNTYVGVENLLQNKQGKTVASSVPNSGKVIRFEIGDILIGNIRPYLRKIWLSDCIGGTNGDVLAIQINDRTEITPEFLYYVISSEKFFLYDVQNSRGVKMPRGDKDVVMKYKLPVPPLEVQCEIVHILDSFTLLTAELTAELTARKKQYEFYRDKVLSHDGIYPMKPLAELGKWSGGKTPSMSEKSFWDQGTIPWISSKDMKSSTLEDTQDHITEKAVKEASMTVYPANSIAVVTRSGILKHTFPVAYVPFETTINQDIKMLVVNEDILPRYAFHVIQGKGNDILVKTKKQGGTVDSLDFQKVLAYKVPVPSKDVQSKLVEVLDNFESICTDLNIGLPAEIEARQKQYEYYRDLLLTFAETGSTLMTDRQTDRQTELSAIKLIQYVFGYVSIELGAIATVTKLAGYEFTKYVTYSDEGKIIALRGLNVKNGKIDLTDVKYIDKSDLTKLNRSKLCSGDMLFTYVGTIGQVAVINENDKYYLAPNVALIRADTQFVNPEYMRYFFQTNTFWDTQINRLLQSSSMKNIPMEKIRKFVLQIPSIEEQNRIVEVLNRFDTLCNDLSAGLPAEIKARQKQYEYYRDKLLSFKELPK
ncbi:restriction endonuclease subunit S [Roseburia hominis]|uniref:restriction endonuclease subunit S n=1 Tax=Roseburia hominis TaxID=301301 RepID=UPI00399AE188